MRHDRIRKENRFKQKAEIESKHEIPAPELDQEGVKDIKLLQNNAVELENA